MDKLCCDSIELFKEEIRRINKKADLSPADAQALKDAWCTIKTIYETHVWMEEENEEQKWMKENQNGGYSERRGRSSTTGRYVSRNDETGMARQRMVEKLDRMRDEAPDFHTMRTIERAMDKLEDY